MRGVLLTAAASSLITFIIMAAMRPEPGARFVVADQSGEPSVALNRTVDRLDLTNTTLCEAIDRLARKTGVSLQLRTHQKASPFYVDPALPVDLQLVKVTVGQALDSILAAVKTEIELSYWGADGVIQVGAAAEEQNFVEVRLYDVMGLMNVFLDHGIDWPADAPPLKGMPSARHPQSRQEAVEELIVIIWHNVDEPSWKDNGGDIGSIREYAGTLVVCQNPHNQDALAALLRRLAEAGSQKPSQASTAFTGTGSR